MSFLSCLAGFEGSISTVLVFIRKAFGDLFLLLFFNCFCKREERQARKDAWPVKYESIEL